MSILIDLYLHLQYYFHLDMFNVHVCLLLFSIFEFCACQLARIIQSGNGKRQPTVLHVWCVVYGTSISKKCKPQASNFAYQFSEKVLEVFLFVVVQKSEKMCDVMPSEMVVMVH